MKDKNDIRLWAKNLRKNIDVAGISFKICDRIKSLEEYRSAKNVMIFYPLDYEVSLISLLDDSKNFYLPRVKGDLLEVCPYSKNDELVLSKFKVKEPLSVSVDKQILDIIFVPALAVDKIGNRLGYGGGYYDRFLSDVLSLKLAVIPEELVINELPLEEYDILCDGFITQKKASFTRG